jgi:phage terminase large subunit-like protein
MLDLSCRDWEARVRAGKSLLPDLHFTSAQEAEADLAVGFFDALHLPDVPGQPLLRDAAGDWFRDLVRAVFGARDPKTNTRQIREYLMMVGKGNSKTTYAAALMIVAMLMNQRPRAEMLFIADTQSISDLAFNAASGMIESDPQLQRRFRASEHHKVIRDLLNGSKLRVKTFDLSVLTGPKPVAVLLDELHLLGKRAHAAKVLRQIRGGIEKSTEGFMVMITTQSDEAPTGVFASELKTARKIRDGEFQGRMLPILYELPAEIAKSATAWQDPAVWPMVMPNLGRSLQIDSLIQDWETERQKGEQQIRIWASQHLNIEIGIALGSNSWIGAEHWEAAADPGLTSLDPVKRLAALLARCDVATVGIDGGGLDDLLGLAVIGREKVTRRWLHWAHAWLHRGGLERRKSEVPKYLDLRRPAT